MRFSLLYVKPFHLGGAVGQANVMLIDAKNVLREMGKTAEETAKTTTEVVNDNLGLSLTDSELFCPRPAR